MVSVVTVADHPTLLAAADPTRIGLTFTHVGIGVVESTEPVWVSTDSGIEVGDGVKIAEIESRIELTSATGAALAWYGIVGAAVTVPVAVITQIAAVHYITRANLKTRLDIDSGDTGSDGILDSIIAGVHGQIDDICGRSFLVNPTTEARYFDAEFDDYLEVDDLTSVLEIATDDQRNRAYSTVWTTNDYEMAPHNAAATNRPFTTARLKPGGVNTFPVGRRTVKITGYWGWPATPAQIIEACYLQCERLYQRRNSPMGVAGPNEFGQLTALAPLDPDVIMLLRPYMRLSMRAV